MSEPRVIKYGNQELPLEDGITLEQAKELMARHFPELADPKVETQAKGGKTVYVFSKKAGTKGADADAVTRIRQRLERVQPAPVDAKLIDLATHFDAEETTIAQALARQVERLPGKLAEEAKSVRRLEGLLADLPPAPGFAHGSIL